MLNVTNYINQIADAQTRIAMQKIFEKLILDLTANQSAFAAHTHKFGRYRVFQIGGLAAKATGDPDIKTVADIHVALTTGILHTIAAGNIDVSAVAGYTPSVQAAGVQRYYLLTVDETSGAFGITEGADHASAAVLPAAPTGKIAVGWIKIVNATNPFTFGTTNTDAAGVTATYGDLSQDDPDKHYTSVPDATAASFTGTLAKVFVQNLTK